MGYCGVVILKKKADINLFDWQLRRLCLRFAYHAFYCSQTQKSLLTWSTLMWTNVNMIAEYCGRICGRRSKDFQDGAEGEGGRGLWRPPASNEETQVRRGGEKRDWRPRGWKAEGGWEGRQKEASPWHGVYRYLSTLFVQQSLAPQSLPHEDFHPIHPTHPLLSFWALKPVMVLARAMAYTVLSLKPF